MFLVFALLFGLLNDFQSNAAEHLGDGPWLISMIPILASPHGFEKKEVTVDGYLSLRMEDKAIYLSQDDAYYGISKNAIWLSITPEQNDRLSPYRNEYVRLRGTFNSTFSGHRGLYSGSFENISIISELRSKPWICIFSLPIICP